MLVLVCVHVCMCVCACVCVRACVCMCVCMCVSEELHILFIFLWHFWAANTLTSRRPSEVGWPKHTYNHTHTHTYVRVCVYPTEQFATRSIRMTSPNLLCWWGREAARLFFVCTSNRRRGNIHTHTPNINIQLNLFLLFTDTQIHVADIHKHKQSQAHTPLFIQWSRRLKTELGEGKRKNTTMTGITKDTPAHKHLNTHTHTNTT